MKLFSPKRRVAAALLMVLALFLIRPGASRLKSRIILSISAGVGRPVDIGSVHLRLLPRPGFDLENLVVYDDPAFGAEPIVRASEVAAALRLSSLLRGRLEIARLDLTEPSLNLAQREDGRWNLAALVEHTARLPLAPTAKAKSEPRPGFPYIEATSGRINFKVGPEKKPYALTNADFSLWQDSENTWGVRLKAQPFRSDLNLSDTGQLQLNGTWQRADSLRDTPLQFSLEWSRAQLGQFTKFFTGNDQGWRGTLQLECTATGTPAQLQISSDASLEDFRRYDILSGRALRMAAHCDAGYSSVTHEFHQIQCQAPVAAGMITFTGDMGLAGSHHYAVQLKADKVPANAAALLAQRTKKNLPADLMAQGTIRGSFSLREDAASGTKPQFEGEGELAGFRLSSAANNAEIALEKLPFALIGDSVNTSVRRGMRFPDGPHVEVGPFALGSGHGAPTVRGWLNRSGYSFTFAGETEIAKALRLARTVSLPAPSFAMEGSAQVDLQVAGSWAGQNTGMAAGFAGPRVTGSARLHNVRMALHGTAGPLTLVSAEMQLLPDKVRLVKLNAAATGSVWTGWVEVPRPCATPETCPAQFALNADQITLSQVQEWVTPAASKRPWYRVLQPSAQPGESLLPRLSAAGRITTEHLHLHGVAASHVSANVSLDAGNLQISELNADLFGGKYRGKWQADFAGKAAGCKGSGSLTGFSLAKAAEAMNDLWIAGTANASYEVKGPCPADFWPSASGTLQLQIEDGVFSHLIVGENAGPLQVRQLKAEARLRAGQIELTEARLESRDGKYQLSGTVSLKAAVDWKLARVANGKPAAAYAITGTLAEPRIAAVARTEQAKLKSPSSN